MKKYRFSAMYYIDLSIDEMLQNDEEAEEAKLEIFDSIAQELKDNLDGYCATPVDVDYEVNYINEIEDQIF